MGLSAANCLFGPSLISLLLSPFRPPRQHHQPAQRASLPVPTYSRRTRRLGARPLHRPASGPHALTAIVIPPHPPVISPYTLPSFAQATTPPKPLPRRSPGSSPWSPIACPVTITSIPLHPSFSVDRSISFPRVRALSLPDELHRGKTESESNAAMPSGNVVLRCGEGRWVIGRRSTVQR